MGFFSRFRRRAELARTMGPSIVAELTSKDMSYEAIADQAKHRRKRLGRRHERWGLYRTVERIARKEQHRQGAQ